MTTSQRKNVFVWLFLLDPDRIDSCFCFLFGCFCWILTTMTIVFVWLFLFDPDRDGNVFGWLFLFNLPVMTRVSVFCGYVNTPLPYHLPLHPVTVTTSQPPRSALRCVLLTDSCFTFPLVLPQPKTHSLSASSMQDPSALPGGGPTYPPSFRTTTSTSCC